MAWRYCALDNQPLQDNQAKINPESQMQKGTTTPSNVVNDMGIEQVVSHATRG